MHHTRTDIQKLVNFLGASFDEVQQGHGESMLRYLKLDGLIDESTRMVTELSLSALRQVLAQFKVLLALFDRVRLFRHS